MSRRVWSIEPEIGREWAVWLNKGGQVKKGWLVGHQHIRYKKGCPFCALGQLEREVGAACRCCGARVVRVRCEESTGGVREWVA